MAHRIQASSYMYNLLADDTRPKIIKRTIKELREIRKTVPFEAIAFRGLSGALIAIPVADKLMVGLMAVRKPNDNSHGYHDVEGVCGCRYIIVDDFIESGSTIRAINTAIKENHGTYKGSESEFLGVYVYNRVSAFRGSTKEVAAVLRIPILNQVNPDD